MFWIFLLKAAGYAAICLSIYLVVGFSLTVIRNYKAHQYFKKNCPEMPTLPDSSILDGHLLQFNKDKRNWKTIDDNHRKYGRTVGMYVGDRPMVSTCDLDFLKSILIDNPMENLDRVKFNGLIDELENDNVVFCRAEQWKKIRRVAAPAFSSHKIKTPQVKHEIESIVNRLMDSFDTRIEMEKAGKRGMSEVNIDDISHRFAIDIVLTGYYKESNSIDYLSEKNKWVEVVEEVFLSAVNTFNSLAITFPFLGRLFSWYINNYHIQAKMRDEIFNLIRKQTKMNLEAKREYKLKNPNFVVSSQNIELVDNVVMNDGNIFKRNMADYIIDQYQAGKLTYSEYMNTSYVVFLAGNKTTGDAVSKIFYFITMHQEVQTKLRDSIFKEGTDSQYLTWVIMEAMRLFPPLPVGSARELAVDKVTSDGYHLGKGVMVMTPAYTIHRLKEYWGEDAEEFRPERWSKASTFHPCQYLSFGVGKRSCLGKEMAMLDMRLLFNSVLRRFKFEKTERTPAEIDFWTPASIAICFRTPSYIKVTHLTPEDLESLNVN